MGGGYHASDHIRHAPFLNGIYNGAEKRYFDPYDIAMKIIWGFSKLLWWIDRAIDWLYDGLSVRAASLLTYSIRRAHTGSYSLYVLWSLLGAVLVVLMLIKAF
jgi:hypothetical protein